VTFGTFFLAVVPRALVMLAVPIVIGTYASIGLGLFTDGITFGVVLRQLSLARTAK
jgi:hypothetical protein